MYGFPDFASCKRDSSAVISLQNKTEAITEFLFWYGIKIPFCCVLRIFSTNRSVRNNS
jgi:hypothetical protein